MITWLLISVALAMVAMMLVPSHELNEYPNAVVIATKLIAANFLLALVGTIVFLVFGWL